MAWDDPVVWILIVTLAVFLFGSNKIPAIARSLGQARREFDRAWRGLSSDIYSDAYPASAAAPRPSASGSARGQATGFEASPDQNPRGTANMEPFAPSSSLESRKVEDDPLIIAAKREGIITEGKTREQIASELAWKLNKK
jgi:TatA/E family protein of Tat protein translocase